MFQWLICQGQKRRLLQFTIRLARGSSFRNQHAWRSHLCAPECAILLVLLWPMSRVCARVCESGWLDDQSWTPCASGLCASLSFIHSVHCAFQHQVRIQWVSWFYPIMFHVMRLRRWLPPTHLWVWQTHNLCEAARCRQGALHVQGIFGYHLTEWHPMHKMRLLLGWCSWTKCEYFKRLEWF